MRGDAHENPRHFRTGGQFRRWLEEHHGESVELWLAFWKKSTGKGGIDYPTARDEALCFGWIDGIRKKLDEERYTIRFTPRTETSKWSLVNVRRYEALTAEGRIAEPGRQAFRRFDPDKHEPYSFERRKDAVLDDAYVESFRARKEAWTFFEDQPPGYRRMVIHWVMQAKREETRRRRLNKLVEACAVGERLFR